MPIQRKIDSDMKNLNNVFLNDANQFHIPDFQRDFVWTDEEAIDLFEDFFEDTSNFQIETSELPGYLLGNIVLIENESAKKWIVVDGQQRLTTLSLIFKALHTNIDYRSKHSSSEAERNKWIQKLSDLNKGYLIHNDAGDILGLKITHESTLPFGEYYKNIIDDVDAEPDSKTDENIDAVFQVLSEYIESLTEEQLNRFIVYIRTRVMLIVTIAPSYAKAFQLFEVLNDRGRSLEPLDLVKNLFLKTLTVNNFSEEKIGEFNTNWSEFITNLQITPKRIIQSSTFIRHFIIARYGVNKRQSEIFNFFNDNKNDKNEQIILPDDILPLSRELKHSSIIYKEIERNPMNDYFSKSQNMYVLFRILRIKQIHPLLMNFYKSSEEIKKEIIDALVRYGASIIFSYTQANTIEKELPSIIKSILVGKLSDEEKKDIVITQINKLIRKRKKLIKSIIPTRNFANARGNVQKKAVDLLRFIELYFNHNTTIITRPRGKRISVEHILSRSLDINNQEYGFENSEEHLDYLNRIGNLTLLYHDENTSLGMGKFKDKIKTYANTNFDLTSTIIEPLKTTIKRGKETKRISLLNEYQPTYMTKNKTIWAKKDIDKRGENIAKLVSYLVLPK